MHISSITFRYSSDFFNSSHIWTLLEMQFQSDFCRYVSVRIVSCVALQRDMQWQHQTKNNLSVGRCWIKLSAGNFGEGFSCNPLCLEHGKKNTSDTEKCSVIAIKLEFQVLAASAPENQVTSMHVVATATTGRLVMSGETNLIWKLKDLTWESNLICLQYKWSSLLSQIRTIFPFSHSSWWSGEFLSSCFISKGLDSDVRAFQLGWNIAVCKD